MSAPRKFNRRPDSFVTAVQLNLDFDGISYTKWGDTQKAKPGDWLVNNGGEVYTVDQESFAATYTEQSPGVFAKTGSVWAYEAQNDGTIPTKEGTSEFKTGDFLVFNDEGLLDGYCMSAEKFHQLYEPAA
jgi:hypothetical protein